MLVSGKGYSESLPKASCCRPVAHQPKRSCKRWYRYPFPSSSPHSLKRKLEPVAGVAAVKVGGGLEDEIQVDIDQRKLAQLGLSLDTVIQRLQQENVNLSGGRLEEGSQRYLVRTVNQFATVEQMREMLLTTAAGSSSGSSTA